MKDVQIAFRQFARSPGFVLTVVLTIALGIGANTAIFSLVHAILLSSLPVSDPKMLYRIGDANDSGVNGGFQSDNGSFSLFSNTFYRQLQKDRPEFEQLAAIQSSGEVMSVRRGEENAKAEKTEYVSGNYFSTFGVGPFAGRVLREEDDKIGAAPAAVLSYQAWQTEFNGDPKVVGSTFYVQSQPVTVVGIAPAGFFGDRIQSDPPAMWIALSAEPVLEGANSILTVDGSGWLYLVGRVRSGTNVAVLQSKISSELRQWLGTVSQYTANGGASLLPRQHVVIVPGGAGILNLQQETGKGLYLLMAISGLVLLVACANVANLLLARVAARKAEISVRVALGAPRAILIRQMLTESLLLAGMGGLAGIGVAYAGTRMILALAFPDATNLPIHANPSLIVLGFCFALSVGTGIVFGMVPAWISSNAEPAEAMRGVNRSTKDRASLPQKSLIVFQAALSLVLLVGAGLLTKSLQKVAHQDFGIQTANRYVMHLDPAGAGYTAERLPALYQQLEIELGRLPGAQSVGLELYSPLEGNNWGEAIYVDGRPAPGPDAHIGSSWDRVSPSFFATVGQPVLRGRGFTEDDTATSRKVAVVSQAFVKKFFPGEDPIGRHFGVFEPKFSSLFEIVGVVADAKYTNPRQEVRSMYFRPLTQTIAGLTESNEVMAEGRSMYINSAILRFAQPPTNLDFEVRQALARINPNLTLIDLHSLDYQVAGNFSQEKLIARLTLMFGGLALVLASVGLYGITSYQVARRTSEIGLRMALGADRGNVVRLVMRGALSLVGLGLLIGVPVALVGARFMADQLYGVEAYDPVSLLAAVAILAVAAMAAGFIPARKASRIEPMNALRTD